MYLTKTFPVKMYDCKVQLIVTKNIVKAHNRINCYHKTDFLWEKDTNVAGCMILCSISKYYMLINEEFLSYNTICHELLHCTYAIAYDRGIHEEEARAWIQGEVGQQIFDFLKSKNVTL